MNNEGMFTFTTSASSVAVLQGGLTRAKSLFINGVSTNCASNSNTGGSTGSSFDISVVSGSNDWWTQLAVSPASSVKTISLACNGVTTPLEKPSWSDSQFVKGLSSQCPMGSKVTVIVNSQKYSLTYSVGSKAASLADELPVFTLNQVRVVEDFVAPVRSVVLDCRPHGIIFLERDSIDSTLWNIPQRCNKVKHVAIDIILTNQQVIKRKLY